MHYLLFYEVVPDYLERRQAYRGAHFRHLEAAVERGELLLAGALAEPADGAVFLFDCADPGVVEQFARTDPYVTAGLVPSFRVRKWPTVVGKGAATPLSSKDFA